MREWREPSDLLVCSAYPREANATLRLLCGFTRRDEATAGENAAGNCSMFSTCGRAWPGVTGRQWNGIQASSQRSSEPPVGRLARVARTSSIGRLHMSSQGEPFQGFREDRSIEDQQGAQHLGPCRAALLRRTDHDVAGSEFESFPACAVVDEGAVSPHRWSIPCSAERELANRSRPGAVWSPDPRVSPISVVRALSAPPSHTPPRRLEKRAPSVTVTARPCAPCCPGSAPSTK
jgi:hypothetical protein